MRSKVLRVLVSVVFRVLSWLPLTGLLWLYSFALIARIKYGHFLTPDVRVPMYGGWYIMYNGVGYFAQAILFGLPFWLILYSLYREKRLNARVEVIAFLLGWSLILIQVFWDPFMILFWFSD